MNIQMNVIILLYDWRRSYSWLLIVIISIQRENKNYNYNYIINNYLYYILYIEKDDHLWFLKDAQLNKATGITLLRNPHAFAEYINSQRRLYILQRQVEDMLLFEGKKKFDIRSYLLVVFKPGIVQYSVVYP